MFHIKLLIPVYPYNYQYRYVSTECIVI